ncbi:MAG: CHASE domain-containing protein [Pseudomonadota bacterium]
MRAPPGPIGSFRLRQRTLLLLPGIALAYFLLGRLGLLLAIPPGFATAVFPPAGLALFCLIRFGPAALPGIWLGSVIMNLSTAWPATGLPAAAQLLMTALIGAGAAGQAGFGWWLLKRHVGLPLAWDDERALLRFALLGASTSTLVGASVGIASLVGAGQIAGDEAAFNWLTWWVGDSIGVALITPLLLLATDPAGSDNRQQLRAVLLPLAITFSLVTVLFVRASQWEQQQIQQRFLDLAGRMERQLQRAFQEHLDSLYQIERFFSASQAVSPADFAAFTQAEVDKFNGHVSLSWVHRVPASERLAYERDMRQQLGSNFQIWQRDDNGMQTPASPRADYFPIGYIEPATSSWLIGFDNGAEPIRRALMETTLMRGNATASPRIALRQLDQQVAAVLVARPVQRRPENDRSSLAVVGIQIAATVDYALRELAHDGIALTLHDSSDGAAEPLFTNLPAEVRTEPAFQHTIDWPFAGRIWRLTIYALPNYVRDTHSWQAWLVMVGGMVFTVLIGAMLLLVHGRALRVQRLVELRTAELARQQQTLQTISDGAADAILLLDQDGCIQMANPAAEALLQHSAVLLRGQPLSRWLPDWQACWLTDAEQHSQQGRWHETRLSQQQAPPRDVEIALTSLQRTGERRYCCLLHDVTERIAHERLKREFVAMVSHELRTPLTSIRGALALLNSGQVDRDSEQHRELLRIATENSKRLLLLVNDLLDFEKLEIGQFELTLRPVAVTPLLQQTVDELDGLALSQSVTVQLQNDLPEQTELMLVPERFVQVLVNLLSNAIKFSSKGSVVQLRAFVDHDEVCIEVIDQGIGIAADNHAFIFQKFWQADASASRKHSGTGLGLAISKGLTEAMAGRIGFCSKPGLGSTFWLRFPQVKHSE